MKDTSIDERPNTLIKFKVSAQDMDRFTQINTHPITGRRMSSVGRVLADLFDDFLINNELKAELKRIQREEKESSLEWIEQT